MPWDAAAKAELSRWAAMPARLHLPYVTYEETLPVNIDAATQVYGNHGFRFKASSGPGRVGSRGSLAGNLATGEARDWLQQIMLTPLSGGVKIELRITTPPQKWSLGNHLAFLIEMAQIRAEMGISPWPTQALAAREEMGKRRRMDRRAAKKFWTNKDRPAYR